MKVLGLISGTSHDGIDAAVVDFSMDGTADGDLRGDVRYTASSPYDDDLRTRLRNALPPAPTSFAEMCELDTLIGQAFAEAAAAAVEAVDVDLICSHGQTVFHWVDGQKALGTLQIGQPAWIAERTGRPVVHDVRSRDVAAGGQGAPLVSVLDTLVLGSVPGHPAALNLGGIANMTVLRPGPDGAGPVAYDIGPANALIDAAVLRTGGHPAGFDVDGRIAARGQVVDGLLARLLDEPYYHLPAPKSTGKELFHDRYLAEALTRFGEPVADDDLVATLTALTARTVADQVTRFGVDRLAVSGGGAANPTMLAMLRAELAGVDVVTSDTFGAPIGEKEAIAFALIGWLTAHGLPATVPSCTGATGARILGSIVPGAAPLVLPPPLAAPPRALTLAAAPEVIG